MGASHSSSADAQAGPANDDVKTSYYELLGVERSATDDEIKKAYRQKALILHPDRNHGDVERTTVLFAQIQSAYEVLSDKQERAWYDAHEGDILRGGAGDGQAHYEHNMRVTTTEDIMGMLGKFSGNVDFTDSPSGFYGFLRETFEQLAKEEQHAADYEGTECVDYPSFGHKDDSYTDVVKGFYSMWNGFATKKSFAWKDLYRLSEAPDRRVRRLMEKENKRIREDGIRDFNRAVQQLVLFVRRRDPRYTPNMEKLKTAEEIAQAQRAATQAQAARSRALHAAKMHEELPEWTQIRDPDESEEEDELEIEEEIYECVACHKTFKSEKQYDAHEKSKKHQKALYALKRQMQKDNANLNLDSDAAPNSGVMTPASIEAEAEPFATPDSPKESVEDMADEVEASNMDTETTDEDQTSQPRPSQKASTSIPTSSDNSTDEDDDEYASRTSIEARLAHFRSPSTSSTHPLNPETPPHTAKPASPSSEPSPPPSTSTPTEPPIPKIGAAAAKRAKKAAKIAAENEADLKFKCVECLAGFASKNELFGHLRERGHAAPVGVGGGGKGGGKKGKRRG